MSSSPPRPRKIAWVAGCSAVIFASMGASCSPRAGSPLGFGGPPAPVVLSAAPTAAEVVAAINANASRVQTYQTQSATIALPQSIGLPLINASIAAEPPSRFRLRATTALTGPEIDLGSNEERFWFWARRNEPPALYTARHDQWANSPTRSVLPIEPAWLADALGMARLDPLGEYEGPTPRGDGAVELRTRVATPDGAQQIVFVVDAQTAWVREQHRYDDSGSLLASFVADRFQYDPITQTSLPGRVRLRVPTADLDLTVNTGDAIVNAPLGDPGGLWTPPVIEGTPVVDVAAAGSTALATVSQVRSPTASISPSPAPLTASVAHAPLRQSLPASDTRPATAARQARVEESAFVRPTVTPVANASTPVGFDRLPAGGRAF